MLRVTLLLCDVSKVYDYERHYSDQSQYLNGTMVEMFHLPYDLLAVHNHEIVSENHYNSQRKLCCMWVMRNVIL